MKMVKLLPEFEYFQCILENRNLPKIRRSKVTDYAALTGSNQYLARWVHGFVALCPSGLKRIRRLNGA